MRASEGPFAPPELGSEAEQANAALAGHLAARSPLPATDRLPLAALAASGLASGLVPPEPTGEPRRAVAPARTAARCYWCGERIRPGQAVHTYPMGIGCPVTVTHASCDEEARP